MSMVTGAVAALVGLGVVWAAGPRRPPPRAAGGGQPGGPPSGTPPDPAAWGRKPAAGRRPAFLRRRGRTTSGELMAVLAHVVALLRSGCPPERAWREAAGVPTNAAGVPLRPALEPLTSGRPVAARAADAIVAASTLSADVGAPLAEVLERVHAALETEDEMAGECAAALAGPRASARILSWLPIAGLVLGMVVGADPVGVLTDGGLGSAVMVAGLACHFLGRATTARMVRSAERAGAE